MDKSTWVLRSILSRESGMLAGLMSSKPMHLGRGNSKVESRAEARRMLTKTKSK